MCIGSDLPHDQDEDGMGVKGKRLIKGFVGRNFTRSGGRSRRMLRRRAAHFIAESSRAAAGLVLCCLDHKQQLMRRIEDVVSRISVAFDEHMRRLFKHNQLTYIPFLLIMSLV
ncbi:hypothetical protein M9H77_35526 [Catharanthus roseus]|uniref:Uncharacterized protein n=1 Tax=Catharanthus roseus TaxID=4058 RepID=A0ACB9ZP92_CATRO|nr:hypothetical protein M9H77_35526 [Catharanthus roseus]